MNYISKLYNIISNKFLFTLTYLITNLSIVTLLRFIPGIHLINKLLLIWGILLLAIDIVHNLINYKLINKIQIAIYSFILLTFLFTILKYPTIENLKLVVINSFILTLFFDPNTKNNKKLSDLNFFIKLYSFINLILSIVSIVIIILGKTIWISETLNGEYLVHAFYSAFSNENSLGISAFISLIFSAYLLIDNLTNTKINKKNKNAYTLLYSISMIIQFIALLLSKSRSVYLGIITFSIIFIFMYFKNKIIRFITILLPTLISLVVIIIQNPLLNNFLTGRDILWKASFNIIRSSPIYGSGSTQLYNVLNDMNVLTAGRVHNIYIEIGASNGLISLIIFFIILLLIYVKIFKRLDSLSSPNNIMFIILFSLTFSILAINLVESSLLYIVSFMSIIFWLILSLLNSILDEN